MAFTEQGLIWESYMSSLCMLLIGIKLLGEIASHVAKCNWHPIHYHNKLGNNYSLLLWTRIWLFSKYLIYLTLPVMSCHLIDEMKSNACSSLSEATRFSVCKSVNYLSISSFSSKSKSSLSECHVGEVGDLGEPSRRERIVFS